jgi:hypothetical protein
MRRCYRTRALGSATCLFSMLAVALSSSALACTPTATQSSTSSTEITMGDGSSQSEVQDVAFNVAVQEFSLSFTGSAVTPSLPNGATPQSVQASLNALPDEPTTVSVTGDGSSGYLVTFSGDNNPHSSIQVTELSGACQVITFGPAPTVMTSGTGTVTATTTATPSSSYPITFSTVSTDCSVTSGGVVTGINPGTDNCVVTASQAGGASWESASATQTLSIQASTPVRLQSFGVD